MNVCSLVLRMNLEDQPIPFTIASSKLPLRAVYKATEGYLHIADLC